MTRFCPPDRLCHKLLVSFVRPLPRRLDLNDVSVLIPFGPKGLLPSLDFRTMVFLTATVFEAVLRFEYPENLPNSPNFQDLPCVDYCFVTTLTKWRVTSFHLEDCGEVIRKNALVASTVQILSQHLDQVYPARSGPSKLFIEKLNNAVNSRRFSKEEYLDGFQGDVFDYFDLGGRGAPFRLMRIAFTHNDLSRLVAEFEVVDQRSWADIKKEIFRIWS
jgi:hypothetical protein